MRKYDRTSVFKRDILGRGGKQYILPWGPGKDISTIEAAERLGISHDTVRRMCEAGELQGWPIRNRKGSPVRVSIDSVDEYIARKIATHSIAPVSPKKHPSLPQPQDRTPRPTR